MRLLQLHSDFIEYEPIEKEIRDAEEIVSKSKIRLEDLVVAFVAVENSDDESVGKIAVDEIKKYLDMVKSSRLLIYPYAHLSSDLAPSTLAIDIIKSVESFAKGSINQVYRAPFGWTKSFNIKVKGHPLAENSKEISKQEESKHAEPMHREKESSALKDEEKLQSFWYISQPGEQMTPVNKYNFSKSIQERESLIKETEEEMRFIILSKIYLITKGYSIAYIFYNPFSVSLCAREEERRRLEKFVKDLIDKDFITSKALGTISITHKGIKEIENLLEESSQTSSSKIASQVKHSISKSEKTEIREIQRLRYDILERASQSSEERDDVMNIFEIAASLGIDVEKDKERLQRIYFYLQGEGLIESHAIGGSFHITPEGRQRVKESPGRIF